MATRNFWIRATIDGRQTTLEGGPRAKFGGFDLKVLMKTPDGIKTPLSVEGYADLAGLKLVVRDLTTGKTLKTFTAVRD